jgi:RsiW-degrading membrane proteinase PrsW (M82 family)
MNGASLIGGPLRLSRQAAFWLFWILVACCALFVGVEQAQYFASYPAAWLLSILLLAATAIPAGVIIYRLDVFEPEPASLITIAIVWGGVVAVTFAGIANELTYGLLQHVVPAVIVDNWAASLSAPINEELYKGLGLVLIYLMARREFENVMDGLVYGAMIGLGFQVVENVQYFMAHAAGQGGTADAVVTMYFLRVVVSGLYSHMLFSGFMGFGFAYFVTQRGKPAGKRYGVFAGCVALSWAAHFVWNSPWLASLMAKGQGAFVGALVIKGLPFLILLVLLGVFAGRREKQVFARLMRSEVGSDAVSQGEFYVLQSGRRRRQALRHMKKNKGPRARSIFKRLMREQINLALLHSKVPAGNHPALEAQRQAVRMVKSQLASVSS